MDLTDTRVRPRLREHYAWWRGVQVTDATVTVGDRTYEVAQIRRLRAHPGRPQPVRQAVLGVTVAQALVVGLAIAGLVHVNGPTPAVYAIAAAQALTTTVLIGLALVRWPTPTELWAQYRGEPTMLYRHPDQVEFGKLYRAVERAMQSQRLLK